MENKWDKKINQMLDFINNEMYKVENRKHFGDLRIYHNQLMMIKRIPKNLDFMFKTKFNN